MHGSLDDTRGAFVFQQNLTSKQVRHVNFFQSNGTSFLALAAVDANLLFFAWSEAAFTPVTTVSDISGVASSAYLQIDTQGYLCVAFTAAPPTVLSITTEPFTLTAVQTLSGASDAVRARVFQIGSTLALALAGPSTVVYVWDGVQFAVNQTLPGASSTCDAFLIGQQLYVLVAGPGATLYAYNSTTWQFEVFRQLGGYGVVDTEHFALNGELFVALAQPNQDSILLYHWNLNVRVV